MPYEIEHGIPLPTRTPTKTLKYPFPHMKPGDSFGFPREELGKVRAASSYWAARHSGAVKFSTRKCDDGTYRCFCLAARSDIFEALTKAQEQP